MAIKRFLGLPILTIGTSSKAWITLPDLAKHLELGEHSIKNRILFSNAAPFRMIRPRTNEFIKAAKRAKYRGVRRDKYFDLDFALAACFAMSHAPARKVRDQVVYILNNLFYDGFVSTKNYHLPLELRRAITAYVCDVDHYHDIIYTRFDGLDQCRGTTLAPAEAVVEKLIIADYYLTRAEITKIKALDLAVHLLLTHCHISPEERDSALTDILDTLGISREAGSQSDEQAANLRQWVETHHSKDLKPSLGDSQ